MEPKKKSRAERFDSVLGEISDASEKIAELRDELQNWLDNMPENLQGGQKAQELEDTIQSLDDIVDSLSDLSCSTVDFPRMF